MVTPDQKVEMVPIGDLTADPRNVKLHPDTQVSQIALSIERFGFLDPVAVDQNGVVVEGHGRLIAAQHLGMTEVPVLRLTFKSQTERRAYAIAHNQTQQLSPMDTAVVMAEFDRIGVDTGDYGALGYTGEDVIFMELDRQQKAEGTTGSGINSHKSFFPPVVRTVIRFDTQEQHMAWLDGLDWLRSRYPDAMTIAERLTAFQQDYGAALDV